MDGVLKKGAGIIIILFLGFWLVQDPGGFADSAKSAGTGIWDLLMKLFEAFIRFLNAIFR